MTMNSASKRPLGRGIFIAGTDTGVGKTRVACAMLRGFAQLGYRVAAMKPVAAGARRRAEIWQQADVRALSAASNVELPQELINPYCFAPAIAPHLAAAAVGQTIRIARIRRCYGQIARRADLVVVEGVGGLLVPLGPQLSAADLPLQLKIPAILVVGMRLGCLNHALLTAEAMRERGIVLAGWVANQIDPKMRHYQENIKTLSGRIAAPLLGELQYSVSSNLRQMATKLDFSRLALFL